MYVKDNKILNEKQLLKSVKSCRSQTPRQQDLDEWSADILQPDSNPVADVFTHLKTASQSEDGLWYRDYETRSFTKEELEQYKSSAIQQINSHYDQLVNDLADHYPHFERASWPKQESEARAWVVDNNAHTPVVDGLMIEGEGKLELCQSIIDKSDQYVVACSPVIRIRRIKRDAIRAATSRVEIDEIVQSL